METITAKRVIIAVLCLLLPLVLLALPRSRPQPAGPSAETPMPIPSVTRPLPGTQTCWTLAEARIALKQQPDSGYLQYVVLQLARQEGRLAEVRDDIPLFATRHAHQPAGQFGLFTDPRAVQQRLQLQAMLADQAVTAPAPVPPTVAVDQLHGPVVPDRPWTQWLGSRLPTVSPLSRCVPDDFYLAEFRSLDRLAAVLDAGRTWLGFLNVQIAQDASELPVRRRLQQQLVFDVADKAVAPLVEQVALTGSDPFLGEGSDVTLLMQLRPDAVEAFRGRTERALSAAAAQPGAGRSAGNYLDIGYTYVASADRRISAYAVTLPSRNLHIRSNSRAALHRVLATVGGTSVSLGDTDEFRYIRTQLPLGANEEDGLVYLSHAFLQRLVSPPLQISEARRRIGQNRLRMIANAAQLYRTQFNKAPGALDDLALAGYLPTTLASPLGGTCALAPDGITAVCSVLGTADNLTPCIELPVSSATTAEAEEYRRFAKEFGPVSRQWLAPIALRLQTGPRTIRAEALLLPPADNPARAEFTRLLGTQPEALDPLPVARSSIASIGLRLNKERWSEQYLTALPPRRRAAALQLGIALAAAVPAPHVARAPWAAFALPELPSASRAPLAYAEWLGLEPAQLRTFIERGVGNQAALHLCDAAPVFNASLPTLVAEMLAAARRRDTDVVGALYGLGGTLTLWPSYLAIPVRDPQVVDAFLAQLDQGLARMVPTWRADWSGAQLQGEFYHFTTKTGQVTRALGVRAGPLRYRVFWARIGDGLYIANQPRILDELRSAARMRSPVAVSDRGPVAHAMLKLRPAHLSLALPGQRLAWEEANREACQRNLAMLSAAARAFAFTPPVTRIALDQDTRQRLVRHYASQFYGCDCACPDGGRYTLAEDGRSFSCSVHGSLMEPRQPERPVVARAEQLADVTATLTLTPEGLRVVMTLTQR